ncbi:MICAL-like protein 1 isoform X1 [Synchiropus splendidus]|uniref:MICAL-like protein 1 isoform X1 n=1 Tax=Synchiropus splendidus TaxID=270530 RepID=UPI00237E6132|nr:MICAL-like protein 1 isoform X1 [Synchiropus splendidus]
MMGSLKALQEWCRMQCEPYQDVEIRDMSTSFRDGLAFCAIIHRHRPELIDFSSLSKENVYENNRLAFEVAETQLGIPALLDPEDMVSMKVPDRLSIITYVSQYYNFFNNKSQANPPCMKRLGSVNPSEPAQKKPPTPFEAKVSNSEPADAEGGGRSSTLSSTCAICHKHVHLVQRFLVEGKLYHRNCFRCTECHSTLLPGSYKFAGDSVTLVCTHHIARQALANQNGRPDLSKGPDGVQSARIGRSATPHHISDSRSDQTTDTCAESRDVTETHATVVASVTPAPSSSTDSSEDANLTHHSGGAEEGKRPSTPPNPFDESDEGEEEHTGDDARTVDTFKPNGDLPSRPVAQNESASRPVPAPRRIPEPTPPPRPSPRVKLPRATDRSPAREHLKPPTPPKPRARSRSPGSLSGGSHKPKDPPWLALVQSESKKKKAPAPPPLAGVATPINAGSLSPLKGEGSRPSTPPAPANPFEDDEDEEIIEEEESETKDGSAIPSAVVASHPWYSISQAADASGAETPRSGGSPSRSASPASGKSKKRPAPRVPHLPASSQVLPHSQSSSCSPSPALSIESLSSGSDHSSSQPPLSNTTCSDPELGFTKSVSEPSICSPSAASPPSSSSTEGFPHPSLSTSSSPMPSNTSSAPATPQTGRSCDSRGNAGSPPQPVATISPLAIPSQKRTCKENPFNRKASPSPSPAKTKSKPPKGPRPSRPPAPGHGFPLIKRKVQSDQYIPTEDIYGEMGQLEKQLDELEQRGVELEKKLRDNPNDEDEEHLLVDWFTLIHDKHLLVRREAELVYTAKQQNLEERQADVEYELRCLLNKPEKDWSEEDKSREQELMAELVTIIEQRNQIVNNMDQDRQREEEEDKLMEAMLKKKDFHKDSDSEQQQQQLQKKKGAKFKPIKVLKRLSHKGEPGKSPRKEKS